MPQGFQEIKGALGVLVMLCPEAASTVSWGWEMLCPLAALPPTMGPVSGKCTRTTFWVNFRGLQELGAALGDI